MPGFLITLNDNPGTKMGDPRFQQEKYRARTVLLTPDQAKGNNQQIQKD